MDSKAVFNATICILGIAIFLIHSVDLVLKKGKRRDEIHLLVFFLFTAFHFATYLTFTLIKTIYTSNPFIIGFYTAFYIMNNLELLFFFVYAITYISPKKKVKDVLSWIHFGLLAIFLVLDVINVFAPIFFYAENGVYMRAKTMFISQGYQLVSFSMIFILALSSKKINITEKIAFVLYCVLPFGAIIVQNLLPGYAIAYLSIVISIEILYLFANVRKNVDLANEARKNKEAEVLLMMSQIKPHFVYNTLSSISTLIKINPDKAQKALDDFTEYLRMNLSTLSDSHCIPFEKELRHIEIYLALESMRFDERLSVDYEIQEKDFLVPPLSIQPLVENAVKHGILKKIEGGKITIRTYQDKGAHVVEIIDDGVGFDPKILEQNGNEHVGLKNVSYRLSSMCDAEMDIQSELGKGTTITVRFNG